MRKQNCRTVILFGSLFLLPGVAGSQTPFNATADSNTAQTAQIGGNLTIDLITVRSSMPGVALRFGSVVVGSEMVDFDGKTLVKGQDYQIDYAAGVIYLMRGQKAGQTVRVSYRYDPKTQAQAVGRTQFSGLAPMKFDLVPGKVNAILGFGMAERQSDGNVLMSNIYGWNNSIGGLKGLMLVGERSTVDAQSEFEYQAKPGETQTGRSKFVLQNYSTALSGGTIDFGYQDISSNFAGFGAVKDAGYEQQFVDQLTKERGLKRTSFGMKDVHVGQSKISNGFRQVRDGSASVDWRSFAFDGKGFKFDFKSQSVDSDFTRFADLAEGDREQLRKEAGMKRQSLSTTIGALSYSANQVKDGDGQGIFRRNIALDTSKISLSLGDQRIDQNFRRFDSLWEDQRGQWAREQGLKREWLALDAAVFGKEKQSLFKRSELKSTTGEFSATDVNLANKSWSLQHSVRDVTKEFGSLGALSEGEMDANIKSIANMYGPGVNTRPDDRRAFLQSAGIDRSYTRFAGKFFKDWDVVVDNLKVKGQNDSADVFSFGATGKKGTFNYRKQTLGDQFSELTNLMDFEKQKLGTISGMDRTDFGMNLNLSSKKKMSLTTLNANSPEGELKRTSITYNDPKIDLAVNTRQVGANFNSIVQLLDPEKDLLTALKGFKERDAKLKWQIATNLKLESFLADSESEALNQSSYTRNFQLNWNPDKKTAVEVLRMQQQQSDPLQVLFSNMTQKITLSRDFGRLGKILYFDEKQDFEGKLNQSNDFSRQYMAYETKLSEKTAVRTEQTRTRYQNGDKEDISANTISTELTKKAGVSLTDVHIDRTGSDHDERKRNYGFWFDFGKGFRLNYGYARQINGPNGTMNSNLGLSPGTLGFLKLDNASYAENRWDALHTQGLSNVSLQSASPMNLGLIKNFTFNFSMDTATDNTSWVRENRLAGIAGTIGSNKFSVDYRGQMSGNGFRGIDRSFKFETDQSDKRAFVGRLSFIDRKLPNDDPIMIRDLSLTWRPAKGISLTNQMTTNPEDPQMRQDVPMFHNANPWRVNKWTLNVDRNPRTSIAASWEERINDVTKESSRLGGLTFDLFKTSGSPLQLFYGVESRWGNRLRQTAHRYYIKFDQRPGPNQVFSIYAGNLSYEHSIADGAKRNNWSLNLNYQLKF